jgi:hypothetical protein
VLLAAITYDEEANALLSALSKSLSVNDYQNLINGITVITE